MAIGRFKKGSEYYDIDTSGVYDSSKEQSQAAINQALSNGVDDLKSAKATLPFREENVSLSIMTGILSISGNIASTVSSRKHSVITVSAGEQYLVTGGTSATPSRPDIYCPCAFVYKSTDTADVQVLLSGDHATLFTDAEITIPDGYDTLVINTIAQTTTNPLRLVRKISVSQEEFNRTYFEIDSLPHKNRLYGKKIVNFGDSIFGNKRPPNDISTAIANITGATVYNLGFGGCRMSQRGGTAARWDAFAMYALASAIATNDFSVQNAVEIADGIPAYFAETRSLLESIDFSEIDIITIAYGTNDWTGGVPVDNAEDLYDVTTFCGALRYSLETIMAAYPQLHVFVCTPTYRFWMNDGGTFLDDSDTRTFSSNGQPQTMRQFIAAVIDVSREYHLKSINNYDDLGINKYNRTNWFPAGDGTHHNPDGGRLIAEHMASIMF